MVVQKNTCHEWTLLLSEEIAVISYGSTNAFSYQSMFQASIFSSWLDSVKSRGFVSKDHIYLQQVTNCSVLCCRCQADICTWCRGLPGLCWAGNPASIQSREEMKKRQFLKLIWEKWGEEVFLFNMVIYRFEKNLSISLWIRSFVSCVLSNSGYCEVHSTVLCSYQLQIPSTNLHSTRTHSAHKSS